MKRLPLRILAGIAAALTLLVGCGPPADLPAIPELDTERVLPAVRQQMESAENALLADPDDALKNGELAMVLHAYGRHASALELYERARRLAPRDPRWPYYQSDVKTSLGQPDEALAALDAALALSPDHIDVQAKRGEALFLLGQHDEAEAVLQAVVERNPSYPLAQFYLARILMERQQWQAAATKFEDLIERGLRVRDLHQNLGVAYRMLGEMDKAQTHLSIAARDDSLVIRSFDPINMVIAKLNLGDQPHILRARNLYMHRNLEGARRELDQALAKNPDSLNAHLHMIRIAAEQQDLYKAREHFDRVQALEPNNPTAYASMGLAHSQAGNMDDAIAAYRRAAELESGKNDYRIAAANVLGRAQRYDEVLQEIEPVLAADPTNRQALFLYGTAQLALEDFAAALATLDRIREERDPLTPMILRGVAVAQHGLGNSDASADVMRDAIETARAYGNDALLAYLESEQARLAVSNDGG